MTSYHSHQCNHGFNIFTIFNTRIVHDLEREFPGRVRILRYEDMATDTDNRVTRLFRFVGMQMDAKVRQFVDKHTKRDVDAPNETFRKSKEHHKEWINKTQWTLVEETQTHCRPAMKLLGYMPTRIPTP